MNCRAGRREASSSSHSRIVLLAWISSPPQSIWKRRAVWAREAQCKPSASYNRAVEPSAKLPNLGPGREAAAPWLAAHGPPSPTPCPSPPAPHPFSDWPHASVSPWDLSSSRLPPCLSRCSPTRSSSPARPPWVGGVPCPTPELWDAAKGVRAPFSCTPCWGEEAQMQLGHCRGFFQVLPKTDRDENKQNVWVFTCRQVGVQALTVPRPMGPQRPGDL